jgi:hypothetical protein
MDQLRLCILKHDSLKIFVDLQTAFAADTHLAEGATERGKVTYVPSGNTNADCFQDKGIIQFNYLFIYVLTQQPWAFYRVSTDTNNRHSGQH